MESSCKETSAKFLISFIIDPSVLNFGTLIQNAIIPFFANMIFSILTLKKIEI